MATLYFEIVSPKVENTHFDCGIESINEYVKNSYFPVITQHAYAYSVICNDVVLGYYQIQFREITLDSFPEDIAEYDPMIKNGQISALHIRFIAIDKLYQRRRIGSSVLRVIIQKVKQLTLEYPIRVITIDARDELVKWYEKEGFKIMKKNTPGQDGVTTAMYFDCMRFESELEQYVNSNCE